MKTAYRYQQKAIDWAKEKALNGDHSVPLFVDMRLGKTIITIKHLKEKFKDNPKARILIVCPLNVIQTWVDELEDEGIPNLLINTKIFRELNGMVSKLPGWFITNYETITFTDLDECDWDAVFLDESTKIKDHTTKISKKITEGFVDVPCKGILTGTPAPEKMLDYFQQLKFLYGEVIGCKSWYQFKHRFFRHDPFKQGTYKALPGFEDMFSKWIANKAYILKRDQVGIGSKKVYEDRYVEMDKEARKEYDQFEKTWFTEDFETKWILVVYNFLRQMTGGFPKGKKFVSHHKIREVQNILDNELAKDDKVVIWCFHTAEIEQLARTLGTKWSVATYYGKIPLALREVRKKAFQSGKVKVFIAQIMTGQMGIDLSIADTVINYSQSYSATQNLQIEDRVIHPEKKRMILYINLITKNAIDEDIKLTVKNKIESGEKFLRSVYTRIRERVGY